ncbi:fructose-6-phosphate aldolase [Gallibacterium anatis]|uniref:Fructose-6-phosphate aldolase n=3 Tax=Gallibacterium anatis TaxID=750 RepID=A0A0A2WWH9_9PAST|nr:fructose-6-phosphate aldolase [Gallibacterium anatis]AEC17565.1 fructose-6-phosphate aldolase [Gallibacterium anatis UMN179]KGQ24153.1 fructose-6-phosphate aldolase [Gallibacterium anatis]KGQ29389.1 fructose-6-phosphate aldolase [Gallibacterium anatis]KGQ42624.1 fructose-6-phosphate aldolase [Gallibacterium anatis IPDH697-78]KGQ44059.1 fructose-6-phosphate aldolase [Gallibacterium anatis]
MEFYLDTANVNMVKKLYHSLPIAGVTTNPSIIAKEKKPIFEILNELQDILGNQAQLFTQVLARSSEEMVEQAILLQEKIPNLVIKIPVTLEGINAIKQLSARNIPTLGTAVYGAGQGFIAGLAGAKYIAPYVNRIDNQGGNGIQVVHELQTLLNLHCPQAKILAASFKTPRQVLDAMLAGCQAITISPDIAQLFLTDPAVFAAIDQFEQDWENAFNQTFI